MTAIQFTDHFTDHIVQIQTVFYIWKQDCILFFDRFPVYSMHILYIESITVGTPCLIEDLCPFFRIIGSNLHIGKVDSFTKIRFAGRDIGYIKFSSFIEKSFFTAGSYRHGSTIGNDIFFLFL